MSHSQAETTYLIWLLEVKKGKKMNIIDKYNLVVGAIVTALTAVFGVFWYLFALFLLFNVFDWLTGWYKARKQQKESSRTGAKGIVKKLGYWVVIAVAFALPLAFVPLGELIGVDLSFLQLIGWFTLACLMVNEVRSILENLVELGYNVPQILIKGLAVTDKIINAKSKNESEDDDAVQK